jgi:hypothetical protein
MVVLQQDVTALPSYAAGSQYALRFRVRTINLNRRLPTELKLNYAGGGYRFFRGRPLRARTTSGAGIPSGTSAGWIPIVVTATAWFPLQSINAFIIDSGPGPLSGRVWIDDIELHFVGLR